MRNCNQYFFSLKKYVLSQKKALQKRGGFSTFPSKLFFLKNGLKIIFLHTAEAVTGRCSVKKVFLEIWQNSQENTCDRVSFLIKLKVADLRLATLLKKRLWHRCFPVNFAISKNTFSYRTPPMAASDIGIFENSFLFYG